MENRYKVGDEVEVSFMGTITEITSNGKEIWYTIDSDDRGYARRITEKQIFALRTAEKI